MDPFLDELIWNRIERIAGSLIVEGEDISRYTGEDDQL